MSATARLTLVPAVSSNEKPDDVLIHVRFYPNADIATIDACPDRVSPQIWFERLRAAATQHYQTLAGGRGFFRIPRNTFESILADGAR